MVAGMFREQFTTQNEHSVYSLGARNEAEGQAEKEP